MVEGQCISVYRCIIAYETSLGRAKEWIGWCPRNILLQSTDMQQECDITLRWPYTGFGYNNIVLTSASNAKPGTMEEPAQQASQTASVLDIEGPSDAPLSRCLIARHVICPVAVTGVGVQLSCAIKRCVTPEGCPFCTAGSTPRKALHHPEHMSEHMISHEQQETGRSLRWHSTVPESRFCH